MMEENKKQDGFKDEQYIVIPTEAFSTFAQHPLVRALYLTDVGFFPHALHHYRERRDGADEYILLYCTEGEGYVQVGGRIHTIRAREACCIPIHAGHKYYASQSNPWSIFWVHFKGENVKYFPLEEPRVLSVSSQTADNRIMTLFHLLFRVLRRNYTQGNFIYISQVLSLILSEIYFREKGNETGKQNRHITSIVHYMYANMDKSLSLEDLAEEFHLSKSYINAIFKKYADRSPIDFFLNIKMQEACKLLRSTNLYIFEIGRRLGYEDPYYFSRAFKKVIGISPKEYRDGE